MEKERDLRIVRDFGDLIVAHREKGGFYIAESGDHKFYVAVRGTFSMRQEECEALAQLLATKRHIDFEIWKFRLRPLPRGENLNFGVT